MLTIKDISPGVTTLAEILAMWETIAVREDCDLATTLTLSFSEPVAFTVGTVPIAAAIAVFYDGLLAKFEATFAAARFDDVAAACQSKFGPGLRWQEGNAVAEVSAGWLPGDPGRLTLLDTPLVGQVEEVQRQIAAAAEQARLEALQEDI